MGLESLIFQVDDETIYTPETVASGVPRQITMVNNGLDAITGLGFYVSPATTLGDVDYPADFPPDTDYQDLLKWGSQTVAGVNPNGGLQVTLPQSDGSTATNYVSRSQGSTYSNRLRMKDLAAGEEASITFTLETPPATAARRLFISLVFDID